VYQNYQPHVRDLCHGSLEDVILLATIANLEYLVQTFLPAERALTGVRLNSFSDVARLYINFRAAAGELGPTYLRT
jgi:hypothetical protein